MKKLLAAMFAALLMVGCGGNDLDDMETRDKIIAEAIDWGKLQEKGEEGEQLYYAPNQQTPYTGWVKVMWGNEQVRLLSQYKDGKGDGLFTSWYEKGQKEMEGYVKDGKPDGFGSSWHENGQKKFEGNCKDGKKDGLWTFWYENGQKKSEENLKDDKLMTAVAWKPNGEKCPVTKLIDGNGVALWYKKDGTEELRQTYKEGEIVRD